MSLENNFGCQIREDLKIAAIVNAAGGQYSDTICSERIAIKRGGGTVTSTYLIQAMAESFRIHGKAELDTSDS